MDQPPACYAVPDCASRYSEVRVRCLHTDDLRSARKLAERVGFRGNNSEVVRFCVALVSELARSQPDRPWLDVIDAGFILTRSVPHRPPRPPPGGF